ncbi:MAG: N-6 DNA methylase [Planctomycetaceae bacterium]|jgi:phospholipid N-methyltransferase|nr:N-6 DNA methylase [Planctomycetaceae bacterium]
MVIITETKKFQAFYTKSTPIVDYMIGKLSLKKSDRIFEPCGGDGVFVESILSENYEAYIDICEINSLSVTILNQKFSNYPNVTIRESDTLLDVELVFSRRYEKIIANPPYGAWQDYEKRKTLKKLYPDLYVKESYVLFLYRCIELLKEDGILTFIVPDTFLNLHSHNGIRKHILTQTQILELVLFPSGFFPNVNFGYANLAIITLRKKNNVSDCYNNSFNVFYNFSTVEQLTNLNESNINQCVLSQKDILENSDSAFFVTENMDVLQAINKSRLRIEDIANCVTGFYSGDDKQFLHAIDANTKNSKKYKGVIPEMICCDYKNRTDILDGIDGKQCFIPIVKGGNIRYLKPEIWFMNWSKEAVQHYKTNKKARFQNSKYYFKYGIGVPMISASNITASLIENKLFDQSIVGIFPKDEKFIHYLLAFFNSSTCNKLIRTINPSANNPANYIKKIPLRIPDEQTLKQITIMTRNIVSQVKKLGYYDKEEESKIQNMIQELYGF